jgi:alcohol dehydrogenase class IV
MQQITFVHDAPSPRVVFEVGGLGRVADETLRLGHRAVLVAGAHEQSAADQVAADLGAAVVVRIGEVAQHVPVEVAQAAVAEALTADADVVVALGGGSATGLAKAIAKETGLPIVAVPTTYAGSEMTPIWGLTDEQGKTTGRDPVVLPRTVVYDPVLTLSLPPALTASSGMNALAHCVEALYAPDASPVTVLLAEEGIRALARSLPAAVARPDDLAARSEALYGAWLAGWVLGTTSTGLHHKLAHVLGGVYRLPHGPVHSALLPYVAAFNAVAAPAALDRVAAALGATDAATGLYDLAAALGAPTSLAAVGLTADSVDDIVDTVVAADVVNPRPVEPAELRALLLAAHAGRRP